ncbi:MAG TPA: RNA polymerase sigma factor [Desulfuromonadales bacterium]|nr:RNA polymerase sigma factor [Desulfuromonadales bacterium]
MGQSGAAVIDGAKRSGYSQSMDGRTEKILLERARGGDGVGFEELVRAHTAKAISLAYRLVGHRDEAEDIAQEAFLRLYRSLPNFRGESTVATWLYRTVSHLAIDHLRREQLRRKIFFLRRNTGDDEMDVDPMEVVPDPGGSPRDLFLAKEAGRRLSRALDKLSPRQRAVFVLRHQEELPLKEIAKVLGLEEGTVKVHLHRAVSMLRKELKDLNEVT